jgi:hypothetical protein
VQREHALSDKMERSSNRCGMAPFSRVPDSSCARGGPLKSNDQLAAANHSIHQRSRPDNVRPSAEKLPTTDEENVTFLAHDQLLL